MALRSASHMSFDNVAQAEQWLRSNGFDAENFLNQVANESAYTQPAYNQPAYTQTAYASQSRGQPSGYSRSATYAAADSQSRASGASSRMELLLSNVEQLLRNAKKPVQIPNARRQVKAGKYSGVKLNEKEEKQVTGPVPLSQYIINEDSNPEILKKRLEPFRVKQDVAVRHLRPPTPPQPEIVVVRERRAQVPPAPAVVSRQAQTPQPVQQQNVEVQGEQQPTSILIEKWAPYKRLPRKIVFQRAQTNPASNPTNLLIEWQADESEIEHFCKYLGIANFANPEEYIINYGPGLKQNVDVPQLSQEQSCGCQYYREPTPQAPDQSCGCQYYREPTPRAPTPVQQQQQRLSTPQAPAQSCGCQYREPTPRAPTQVQQQQQRLPTPAKQTPRLPTAQAAPWSNDRRQQSYSPILVGDVQALKFVDLDKYGLGHYRKYIQ